MPNEQPPLLDSERPPELRPHDDAIYDLLVAGLGPRATSPLLDVGSGDGLGLSSIVGGTGMHGLALDRLLTTDWRGPDGFARLRADATHLPFCNGAFASVLSSESLEWFTGPAAVLREMARAGRHRLILVQSDWSSLWFDSGDPETSREFTRLYAGPEAMTATTLPGLLRTAGLSAATLERQTVQGRELRRGSYAHHLLRLLRRFLVVQTAVVRARHFDDWRADLAARASRDAFTFSLQRYVAVIALDA